MTALTHSIFSPKPTDVPINNTQLPKPIVNPTQAPSHPGAHPSLNNNPAAYVPQSPSNVVSGVIGPRMVIKGDIEFEGELMIQGKVTGNIRSADDGKSILRIDEKAEVTGDVTVPVIKVSGTLTGTVSANELLHLHPTGTIVGPVKYNNIQLESGGTLEGSLTPEFKNAHK